MGVLFGEGSRARFGFALLCGPARFLVEVLWHLDVHHQQNPPEPRQQSCDTGGYTGTATAGR